MVGMSRVGQEGGREKAYSQALFRDLNLAAGSLIIIGALAAFTTAVMMFAQLGTLMDYKSCMAKILNIIGSCIARE